MSGKPWPAVRPSSPEWHTFGTALDSLTRPTPCHTSPDWTSDEDTDRAQAVKACTPCPLLELCHAAAESTREAWGVWAGIDRGTKTKTRKATA